MRSRSPLRMYFAGRVESSEMALRFSATRALSESIMERGSGFDYIISSGSRRFPTHAFSMPDTMSDSEASRCVIYTLPCLCSFFRSKYVLQTYEFNGTLYKSPSDATLTNVIAKFPNTNQTRNWYAILFVVHLYDAICVVLVSRITWTISNVLPPKARTSNLASSSRGPITLRAPVCSLL